MITSYCKYCEHYFYISKIIEVDGVEYIEITDHCKKFKNLIIDEDEQCNCYQKKDNKEVK